ncbi:MAG: cobalamin-binding protein [Chlorobi bacterium]|nr:cobalamin-binding protein [Chlorobiota bacterium]
MIRAHTMNIQVRAIVRAVAFLILAVAPSCTREQRPESGTIRIVDALQHELVLDTIPRRIVSLTPAVTEALFAIGAGEQVVGVTRFCNYPPEAEGRTIVGDMLNPNLEVIVSLRPDLVVVSMEGNRKETFLQLREVNIPVFVTNPRDISGVMDMLLDLGILTHRRTAAEQLVDSLRRVVSEIQPTGSRPGVLMLVSIQPLMAAGGNTFLGKVIIAAGGKNAAEELPGSYPTLNREGLLELNPDVILFPKDLGLTRQRLQEEFPEWVQLAAFQTNHIYFVNSDIFQRPGPRIVQAVMELHDILKRD